MSLLTYLAGQEVLAIKTRPFIPLDEKGYNVLGEKPIWFTEGLPNYSETLAWWDIPFSVPNWRISGLKI